MYQLRNVTKTYTNRRHLVPAVQDVNLEIGDGEWLAIQGRTGSGKTTLLQILGGLDRPTTGVVDLDGHDLTQRREADLTRIRATTIGIIFQTFNLIPTLSAAENVEAALVPLSVPPAERHCLVAAALENVDLADRAHHLPAQLSGGQQQRVAIARALVKEPKVLLADEPTGNLDEDTRNDVINLLEALWRDLGLTLVMVTHEGSVARRAQRIAVMAEGHLSIQQDSRTIPDESDPGQKGHKDTDL